MSARHKTFTKEAYDELMAAVDALPKEAVERTKASETRKGYDTTGYQYQYLVNALNETLAPESWSFSYRTVKEIEGKYGNGSSFHDVTAEVTVEILGSTRTCVGGHVSKSYGDALKGAITNAFKKTLAFFGPGKKAYEGALDDDYRPLPDHQPAQPPARQPARAAAPAQTKSQARAVDGLTVDCERCRRVRVPKMAAQARKRSCGYAVCGECFEKCRMESEAAGGERPEPRKFDPPSGGACGGAEFTGNRPSGTETMRVIRKAETLEEVKALMKEVTDSGRYSEAQVKLIRPCAEKRYGELARKLGNDGQ